MVDKAIGNNLTRAKLAVVGVGLIGQRHAELISDTVHLTAIVDGDEKARKLADNYSAPLYGSLDEMLVAQKPDGIIIATPNQSHEALALQCIAAGIPILVEKPLADRVEAAERIVAAAEMADVAVLVGHHRRYNPVIIEAKKIIDSGQLGTLVAAHTTCWFYKPDDYFETSWRRQPGAGPVFINLIHDIDLMRYFCGEVQIVQAIQSNKVRGNAVEDSAVVLLRFESGTLGTVTVSDTIASPWSWELTAGENPAYVHTDQFTMTLGGTRGSLSIPDLGLWRHQHQPNWWNPISREIMEIESCDPLARQIDHFTDVILNGTAPIMSGREGLAALKIIAAIKHAAVTGETVSL